MLEWSKSNNGEVVTIKSLNILLYDNVLNNPEGDTSPGQRPHCHSTIFLSFSKIKSNTLSTIN